MFSYTPAYPQYSMFNTGEDTEANAKPVTQTIKTDPQSGEQTMTISGSVQDLTAANPLTPTVIEPGQMMPPMPQFGEAVQLAGPMVPGAVSRQTESQAQRRAREMQAQPYRGPSQGVEGQTVAQPMAQTVAQPIAQPVAPMAQPVEQPYRGPGQGAEAQTVAQPVAQPIAQPVAQPIAQPVAQPVAQPIAQPVAQPVSPAGVPQGASAITQTSQTLARPGLPEPAGWMNDIVNLQGNTTGLASYYGNESNDPQGRNLARLLLKQEFENAQKQQQAQQKVNDALTSGNMLNLAKEAQKEGQEGSYIKAYLYTRLGLTKLAQDEQEKLSPTIKWERVMTEDNKPALVKLDRRGMPIEGYTEQGKMSDKELINVGSARQLDIVGGTYVNDRTGQVGRVVTDKRTGVSYIQTDSGRVAMAGFRPQSSGGTLDMQRLAQIQRQNVELAGDWAKLQMRLQGVGPEAANKYLGEFNAKFGTNMPLSSINGPAPQISLESGQMVTGAVAAPQQPVGQPQGAAPTMPVAPVAPAAPAAQQPVMQPQGAVPAVPTAPVARPTAPVARPMAPAAAPQVVAAPPVRPVQGAATITPAGVGGGVAIPPVFTPTPIQPGETPGAYAERVKREGEAYNSSLRQSEARQRAGLEVGVAQQRAGIEVGQARSQSFNKILDEEVRPQAQAGDTVSGVRKQQFAIFDRPGLDINKIFGLYNAAGEGANAQKFTIVRDILGGMFKPEVEVSQRLAQLNLTPQEKSALMEYNAANQKINAATLKATAGPGSVSDAEQKINRESNVDITKVPALGAYNAMAQSQFDGDRARWKADWALTQPATNALELDREWRKESSRLSQIYSNIARQRIQFIQQNGSTTDAVRQGYKRFPVPEYDAQSGRWIKTRPISEILGR